MRTLIAVSIAILATVGLSVTSSAQVTTATIYGDVQDPSGAMIPGAEV
jgi:hypothetical protein